MHADEELLDAIEGMFADEPLLPSAAILSGARGRSQSGRPARVVSAA